MPESDLRLESNPRLEYDLRLESGLGLGNFLVNVVNAFSFCSAADGQHVFLSARTPSVHWPHNLNRTTQTLKPQP